MSTLRSVASGTLAGEPVHVLSDGRRAMSTACVAALLGEPLASFAESIPAAARPTLPAELQRLEWVEPGGAVGAGHDAELVMRVALAVARTPGGPCDDATRARVLRARALCERVMGLGPAAAVGLRRAASRNRA